MVYYQGDNRDITDSIGSRNKSHIRSSTVVVTYSGASFLVSVLVRVCYEFTGYIVNMA